MNLYRVPLAVPYWTSATYRRALRSLRSGHVVEGTALEELRARIIETLNVRDAVLCASGSLALELALRSCGTMPGDEVVIPTFCCSAIVAPILAVGAQPVLADIGEELNLTGDSVGAALTRRTRAIIVPHLFGNPADIDVIAELARGKNICVIDDAAQALGATLHGQPVGSFGDVGVLSFGAEKVCSGVGGGVLVSRSSALSVMRGQSTLAAPPATAAVANFASTLFWRRWRRWTSPLEGMVACKRERDPTAPLRSYKSQGMSNLNATIACSSLETLAANLAARRARVDAYRRGLVGIPGVDLVQHRPGSACLTQVVRCRPAPGKDDVAGQVVAALARRGFEIQGSYLPLHLLENFSMCVWDSLPHADRVWAELIELPCEPDVNLALVKEIAAVVKATVTR